MVRGTKCFRKGYKMRFVVPFVIMLTLLAIVDGGIADSIGRIDNVLMQNAVARMLNPMGTR